MAHSQPAEPIRALALAVLARAMVDGVGYGGWNWLSGESRILRFWSDVAGVAPGALGRRVDHLREERALDEYAARLLVYAS